MSTLAGTRGEGPKGQIRFPHLYSLEGWRARGGGVESGVGRAEEGGVGILHTPDTAIPVPALPTAHQLPPGCTVSTPL